MSDKTSQNRPGTPPPPELVETVKAVKATLERIDEEKASDPVEITNYIKDESNHLAIRKSSMVDVEIVETALEQVVLEEVPPFVAPEELISLDAIHQGKPLICLEDWKNRKMVGLHHAPGGIGSTGTFIVACTPTDTWNGSDRLEIFVIKELTIHTPAEVFASAVMQEMHLVSPRMIIPTIEEFTQLLDKLRDARLSVAGTCSRLFDPAMLKVGVLLMNFMEGEILPDLSDLSLLSSSNPDHLREVGRIMAVDMALNNMDRIPVVWTNDGNGSNLMISEKYVACIDNSYYRVLHEAAAQSRADKIRECIQEVHSGQLGEHANRVRDFFHHATQGRVDLTDDDLRVMFDGLQVASTELSENHEELFSHAASQTRRSFYEYVQEGRGTVVTSLQLDECLDLGFCNECATMMTPSALSETKSA